jgi:hypothetical protein
MLTVPAVSGPRSRRIQQLYLWLLTFVSDTFAVAAEGGLELTWDRPTSVRERVSRYLETHPGSADRTGGRVRDNVKGKTETELEALSLLVAESFVETSSGPRNATIYTVVKPFTDQ